MRANEPIWMTPAEAENSRNFSARTDSFFLLITAAKLQKIAHSAKFCIRNAPKMKRIYTFFAYSLSHSALGSQKTAAPQQLGRPRPLGCKQPLSPFEHSSLGTPYEKNSKKNAFFFIFLTPRVRSANFFGQKFGCAKNSSYLCTPILCTCARWRARADACYVII